MRNSTDRKEQRMRIRMQSILYNRIDGVVPSLRNRPRAYLQNTYRLAMVSLEEKHPLVYGALTEIGFPTPYTTRPELLD